MTDAKHEAPAEGAGEVETWTDEETCSAAEKHGAIIERNHSPDYYHDVISFTPPELREFVLALRARSSAPEAREGDQPFSYAYRYPDPMGGTVVRLDTNGREISGAKPVEAIALYTHPAAPSAGKLRIAAEEFCRRVEAGEIRSKRSYAAFKDALKAEGAK